MAISGQVTAANPTGVNVSVQPASLVNATNNVTVAGTNSANSGPVGKLQGSPGDPPGDPPGPAGPGLAGGGAPLGSSFSTTTIGSGFFTFPAQFASPGNYLVTFSKPGYATQKFVVAATGAPVNLNVTLIPGPGSISGLVIGPHGPLGGATVTVTDGTMTCSARTPTEGSVGKWSISGLTTPDTYLVTATAPGYGASTTLVNLAAGKTSSGVDLTVKAGVASIVGTVGSPRGPVGGINVTATDGTVTQSVTTLTGGRDLGGGIVGTYVIPNLSVQGPWTVTASGPGWISQTQRVSLSKPAVAKAGQVTANFQLSATTATVMGTVVSPGDGLGGVGVVMTGKLGTYKALTATAPNSGSFALANVLPGHYVLLFSLFGYRSESVEVNLRAGQILMVPSVKMPAINPSSEQKAEITGNVVNLATGNAVTKGNAEIDGKRDLSVSLGNNGSYIVAGLGAGVHRVTVTAAGLRTGQRRSRRGYGRNGGRPTCPAGATGRCLRRHYKQRRRHGGRRVRQFVAPAEHGVLRYGVQPECGADRPCNRPRREGPRLPGRRQRRLPGRRPVPWHLQRQRAEPARPEYAQPCGYVRAGAGGAVRLLRQLDTDRRERHHPGGPKPAPQFFDGHGWAPPG